MFKRFLAPLLIVTILLGGLLALAIPSATVSAQAQGVCTEEESPSFLNFPTWYKYLDTELNDPDGPAGPLPGKCEISFDLLQDWSKILLAVFEIILRIGGIAAVGFIIFGGFQYLISQGEPERTKGAKSTILNALIGLVITLSATGIVNLIGRNI